MALFEVALARELELLVIPRLLPYFVAEASHRAGLRLEKGLREQKLVYLERALVVDLSVAILEHRQ